jgi:tRNA (mo5U34)-methyltransferase
MDIEFRQMSVYEVGKLGERFDLVIFMGVLYHLRHPLLALDLVHEHVVDDLMLFQCLQRGDERIPELEEDYPFSEWAAFDRPDYPKLFFVEERYASDPTNWFIPNKAGMEAMLRSSGFTIEANPEREVYLCRRGERHYAVEPPPM